VLQEVAMRRSMTALLVISMAGVLAACGDDEPPAGAFGASCASDDECDEGRCFEFGSKGKRCTLDCPASPDDCPNDGQGCNDKGVCKVP
jgi:hypothetical protein